MSDVAGQDIAAHHNDVRKLIQQVRSWLTTASKRTTIPGGDLIANRFAQFQQELPAICQELHKHVKELTFIGYKDIVAAWLRQNTLRAAKPRERNGRPR